MQSLIRSIVPTESVICNDLNEILVQDYEYFDLNFALFNIAAGFRADTSLFDIHLRLTGKKETLTLLI